MMLAVLCIAFVLLIAYPIAIYPLLALGLAALRSRPWREGPVEGDVVHVITVFNEERRIRAKLENALDAVPAGMRLETLVVSDGSDDGTEGIVREFESRGVRWLALPRRGKEFAQQDAIRQTCAPWIVFSDASTLLDPGAIPAILAPFADPRVGAVSGTDRLDTSAKSTGEDLYVKYEMALRRAEASIGSLVGLSGCFFATRRDVAEELLEDVPSDMGAALIAIRQNRRAVAADGARCTYSATRRVGSEFRRKRRTALRGIRCLLRYRAAISWHRPLTSWQIVSHKWLRFLAPVFAVAALICLALAAVTGEAWAMWLAPAVAAGVLVGGVSLFGWLGLGRLPLLRAVGFFMLSNAAVLAAWWFLLAGVKEISWTPTARA